jgi:hypothetical protein
VLVALSVITSQSEKLIEARRSVGQNYGEV